MSEFKNPQHFNIGGDKTVTVTLVFDVGEKAGRDTILRCAADYALFLANENAHKSWGRTISIEEKT